MSHFQSFFRFEIRRPHALAVRADTVLKPRRRTEHASPRAVRVRKGSSATFLSRLQALEKDLEEPELSSKLHPVLGAVQLVTHRFG